MIFASLVNSYIVVSTSNPLELYYLPGSYKYLFSCLSFLDLNSLGQCLYYAFSVLDSIWKYV